MSASVLEQLEGVRRKMDTARRNSTGGALASSPPKPAHLLRTYSQALTTAEKSVDRLSRAMEAAEEEMDVAMKRTGDVQRSQVARKDREMHELRRVIAAKEKSIDSLRETLAATKRTLEARNQQMESTLSARDAELNQVRQDFDNLKTESDALKLSLHHERSVGNQNKEEYKARGEEMQESLKRANEDHARSATAAKKEKKEKDKLQHQADELKEQVRAAKHKVRLEVERRREIQQQLETERQQSAGLGVSKEEEILRLKQQLKEERENFKKAKKWLKAELKAREDMETLFLALREIATVPQNVKAAENDPKEDQENASDGGDSAGDADSDNSSEVAQLKSDFHHKKSKLNADGRKLRAELEATKRMLSQALQYQRKRSSKS